MSQALRKLAGSLNRSRTCAVFINQLREKIGVMFGCFHYSTRVTLADGSQEKIGKIVNQRLPVEVLSYDPEQDRMVPRRVINWFAPRSSGDSPSPSPAGNGRATFSCTPNHLIATPGGYRAAGELAPGDRVLQSVPFRLSEMQRQVVLGGLMGDGALSPSGTGHAARFRFGHGAAQREYADWKASLFANIGQSRTTGARGAVFVDLQSLPELAELRRAVYLGDGKVLSHDYLKSLTPLALAVWYMDDASFSLRSKGLQQRTAGGSGRVEICVEALERTSRTRLVEHLRDTFDLDCRLRSAGSANKAVITFTTAGTARLQELVAPYVHPSMDFKLLARNRDRFQVDPVFVDPVHRPVPMPITAIESKPPTRSTHRFDIEVEGNHNYLVDGVLVHNSPETTPGGRALKFYSSVRLDVRRIESLKDGTDVVGNRVRVKVVKNKVAPPFRQAEFDIMYGEGISREGSIIDLGVDTGIVRKAGAWYTYEGEQLGQGRERARLFLKEHDDVAAEIAKKVREQMGLDEIDVSAQAAETVDPDEDDLLGD